jgi:muramoyltetrapeptide carboxypeptidase
VAVCAPSSVVDAERLAEGLRALEALGLQPYVPAGAYARELFMAGPAAQRAADLHAAFEDDSVAGVVCARGGAGLLQLLPQLDLERLLAHPKVLLGYSDVTPLHAALNARGLVTFHGPMVASDFAEAGRVHRESLLAAVMGEGQRYASAPGELSPLHAGIGEGVLLGGCLSLLSAQAGTPWALRPWADTLLFIEDVNERPYRVDRMLWQLRASGAFEHVRGIVLGEMAGCEAGADVAYRLADVVRGALAGLDVPVALGLRSGHVSRGNVTLPFGVRARLACEGQRAEFAVLEDSVS